MAILETGQLLNRDRLRRPNRGRKQRTTCKWAKAVPVWGHGRLQNGIFLKYYQQLSSPGSNAVLGFDECAETGRVRQA